MTLLHMTICAVIIDQTEIHQRKEKMIFFYQTAFERDHFAQSFSLKKNL
jgi:hypothetical protein